MWNRSKKDDEASSRPATPAPSPSDYGREAIPTSSYAARQSDSGTRAVATIGKSLIIKGLIRGQEDLVIDGRLEGDVDLPENRLTVGVTGHVQGAVRAREIVVLGIQGNPEASERVEIKKNSPRSSATSRPSARSSRMRRTSRATSRPSGSTNRRPSPPPRPSWWSRRPASCRTISRRIARDDIQAAPDRCQSASSDLPPGARRSHALENVSAYLRAHQEVSRLLTSAGSNPAQSGFCHRPRPPHLRREPDARFDYFFSQQEVASRQFVRARLSSSSIRP